jgi:hypothetical protein
MNRHLTCVRIVESLIAWGWKGLPAQQYREAKLTTRNELSGGALLARQKDILGVGVFQHFARFLCCIYAVAMDGDQNAAAFDLFFITFGFDLGQTQTNQSAGYAADRPAHTRSRERGDDRSSRQQRTHTRNCERADSGQPA